MKKMYFLCMIVAFNITISCSEDDVIYINENGQEIADPNIGFASGQFLEQVGTLGISNNMLVLPLEAVNTGNDTYRLDVVIYQQGTQLSGGPWELYKDSQEVFYRGEFPVEEEYTPLTGRNIEVKLYKMTSSTSTRDLIETLSL